MIAAMALLLSGACTEYEVQKLDVTDVYTQGGVDQYSDVLFVVDDSASMTEEQARLAAGFSAFTDVLERTSVDFHLGVVTTDAADEGRLHSGVLDPALDDLDAAFLEAVDVGADGDRIEQGLAQAAAALSGNPSFRRPGADVHVVVVSDEDDQSPGEVAVAVEALQLIAGDDPVVIHALVGDLPAGCVRGSSAADPGERYLVAAALTDGRTDSICAEDYAPMLAQVGLQVAAWNDRFLLSELPEPDSLEVRVDDVLIPEREDDGWTWAAGDNAVVFTGRAIPRPGMEIGVHYRVDVGTRVSDSDSDSDGDSDGDTGG